MNKIGKGHWEIYFYKKQYIFSWHNIFILNAIIFLNIYEQMLFELFATVLINSIFFLQIQSHIFYPYFYPDLQTAGYSMLGNCPLLAFPPACIAYRQSNLEISETKLLIFPPHIPAFLILISQTPFFQLKGQKPWCPSWLLSLIPHTQPVRMHVLNVTSHLLLPHSQSKPLLALRTGLSRYLLTDSHLGPLHSTVNTTANALSL